MIKLGSEGLENTGKLASSQLVKCKQEKETDRGPGLKIPQLSNYLSMGETDQKPRFRLFNLLVRARLSI